MRIAISFVLGVCLVSFARAEELVALPTREGVTQSYLLVAPRRAQPVALAVLFVGSGGKLDLAALRATANVDRGNFLVRARHLFADRGVVAAVVDAPSDQPADMADAFRVSEQHVQDIAAVIADLRIRHPGLPAFLVGTSRGTVSAAAAGARLSRDLGGVVLTASLFNATRRGPGLSGFDFATIRAPLLFVHHVDDACASTPYHSARRLSGKYPLISVEGGHAPRSGPCDALTPHGFLGREEPTVDAIVSWMLKQPYPREIN